MVPLPPSRPTEARARETIEAFSHDPLLVRDPDIGWITRPNRSVDGDETNAQGIRTAKDHLLSFTQPQDKIRIETVGDSYVYRTFRDLDIALEQAKRTKNRDWIRRNAVPQLGQRVNSFFSGSYFDEF